MTEAVFPAILACDTLVMLCANYNDALSANLTALRQPPHRPLPPHPVL